MPLEKLEDSRLSEQAYGAIRDAIINHEIEVGEYFSIQELSEKLGVSRTPVRDAMLRLQSEGLVSIEPYKGAYVTHISAEDFLEIMELRILLEGYAAGVAAACLTESELAQAEDIIERIESAYRSGKNYEAAIIGKEFHALIFNKVNNSRFHAFLQKLETQYGRLRIYSASMPDRPERSIHEHRRLLDALQERDADKAQITMEEHMAAVRDDLLDWLFPEDGQRPPTLTRQPDGSSA